MKKIIFLFFVAFLLTACGDGPYSGSKRCSAITEKGTQCKRNAQSGSIYCWQHQK